MSNEALNQALDALRAAQDHLAPSKTDNSELWYKYADAIVAIQSALEQRMADCPTCEYHKQRAQIWRDEAYKLSGHPLPEREPVLEEREACAKIADEWAVGWPHPSQVIAERIRERGKA